VIKRKANYIHKRPVRIKFISFQCTSNNLKLELTSLLAWYRQKAVNSNSHLKTFYIEFRFQFYIQIKPIESKIIYLLYIFYKLMVLYLKVFKFHLIFAGLYKKFQKQLSCWRDGMTIMTWQHESAFSVGIITNSSCWNNVWKI
jgi:hypothetical protein